MNANTPQALPDLPPTYYLDNFKAFVGDVCQRYEQLLTGEEKDFAHTFFSLEKNAQCLLVRLISRKGPLFRVDKLNYPEIDELPTALQVLIQTGMLDLNPPVEVPEILNLLTVEELRTRFPGFSRTLKKPELLAQIGALLDGEPSMSETDALYARIMGEESAVVRPAHEDTLDRFRLLFFGNLGQDLTEFVLSDLGIYVYENYALDGSAAAFKSRNDLDELYGAIQFRQSVRELIEADMAEDADALAEVSVSFEFPPARRTCFRTFNELGRYAERRKAFESAAQFYRRSMFPPARERLARVYVAQCDFQAAVNQCQTILESPWDEQEATFAQRILERSLKKLKKPIPIRSKPALSSETVVLSDSGGMPVEANALEYLKQQHQCDGWYVENWLFNGLFGMLFWDVIFAPVPDAFYHPFQRGPRDLYYPEFRSKRLELINAHFRLLETGEWRQVVRQVWRAKYGRVNPFVHWPVLNEDLLEQAMAVIPPDDLKQVFGRMLTDLRNHCSGFPDLILFYPNGSYELVEVKGPGDRLQDHQVRWLEFFARAGITARTFYVRYSTEN